MIREIIGDVPVSPQDGTLLNSCARLNQVTCKALRSEGIHLPVVPRDVFPSNHNMIQRVHALGDDERYI